MANTLDTYADALIMECLLTKDSGAIGNEYIDDVITSLRPYVFASFTDLDTVSLPNVTVIPEGAFFETEVETDLDLDWSRITSIGRLAFYASDCITDSTLTLSACTSIGLCAFNDAVLSNVVLSEWTGTLTPAAFSTAYGEYSIINSSYRGIFSGSSIQTLSAPKLTEMPAYFCRGCTSLTSVNLPLAESAAMDAFFGCTSLTSVYLPKATRIASEAFSGCSLLASVSLPLVESLASYAFNGCTALTDFSAPSLTTVTASYVFNSCTSVFHERGGSGTS